jgi:cytochrome b561
MTAMQRYGRVARALHWSIAVLLLVTIPIGLYHDALMKRLDGVMQVHKSIGFTVLALSILRIGWRLTHRPPPLPTGMPNWERAAAKANHALFYTLMLVMPLTGWIFTSAGKYPLSWFWVATIPKLPVQSGDFNVGAAKAGHQWLGYLFAALALLHIAAALRHHFILKDRVLRRMLP